jgi:hypothetical protein
VRSMRTSGLKRRFIWSSVSLVGATVLIAATYGPSASRHRACVRSCPRSCAGAASRPNPFSWETLVLDEVESTSILKTGRLARYPRFLAMDIAYDPAHRAADYRASDLVLWPDAARLGRCSKSAAYMRPFRSRGFFGPLHFSTPSCAVTLHCERVSAIPWQRQPPFCLAALSGQPPLARKGRAFRREGLTAKERAERQ